MQCICRFTLNVLIFYYIFNKQCYLSGEAEINHLDNIYNSV